MSVSLVLLGLTFAGPAQAAVLPCGTVITTPNTTVTLTADVVCTSNLDVFGVEIAADNVTLDLNGYSVKGNITHGNDSSSVGIYVTSLFFFPSQGGNNAVVKNGTVTGFSTGIYLEEVNHATVTGMKVRDNIGPDSSGIFGEGIQMYPGGTGLGNHVITGNQVVHNGPNAGIVLYGPSNNNTVTGNQVIDNNILDTSGHHGEGGPIMQDIGIWLVNLSPGGSMTNNNVSNNIVTGSGLDGIQVATFTNGNFVRSNQISNNGFGQPAGNGLRDGDGIAIFGSRNVVESNSANGNGGNGIDIHVSGNPLNGKSNTIRGNRATNNGSAPNSVAFDLKDSNVEPPCDSNVWASNIKITKNQACVN